MRIAKLVVCLGLVGVAWASAAKNYHVTFNNPVQVSGTELKAGDYTVELAGDKAMIHSKAQSVEASVKVMEVDQKFPGTSVRYGMVNGKYQVNEIQLGGTKTKLIFNN